MSGIPGMIWWFIVTLGVLVTFHEFGHYWVARRCGVKVLRFSVGFGKPLWSRLGKDGTRYQVAWIPLGGYVQFLDERESEVDPKDIDRAFNRQPVLKRIAIVLAGPVANLILCLALFWGAYLVGLPGVRPVVGSVQGIAAASGLEPGDLLLAVDGDRTFSWNQAITPLALAAIDHRSIPVLVQRRNGEQVERTLLLQDLKSGFDQADPLGAVGIGWAAERDGGLVGQVVPDSAAAGLIEPGDRILSLNGQPVQQWSQIPQIVRAAPPGQAIQVVLLREGLEMRFALTPKMGEIEGHHVVMLGIAAGQRIEVLRLGPWQAAEAAVIETRKQARETLSFLARLVTGRASSKNLSGAIGIAQVAQAEANLGFARLIAFMASLSLTLCIMNLLPIPVLDGGHLLYYLIELVSGRPVGDRVLIAGQYAGLLLLAGLIGLAFYNDLVRTIS
jgi:regulator of sigma E protease